jgi:hypothetical protein
MPPERPSNLGRENRNNAPPEPLPDGHLGVQPEGGARISASSVDECITRLSALGVKAQAATIPIANNDSCVVVMPIRIEHVTGRYGLGNTIHLPDQPLIDCRLAEPLARWLGEVVAPVFAANFSSQLKAVRTGPGYDCRNRNHEATGKLSAHASGVALDISGFELTDGKTVSVGSGNDPVADKVLRTIRTAGCGWFTTILGPGSDVAHANHLHFDIQQHGSNDRLRICE